MQEGDYVVFQSDATAMTRGYKPNKIYKIGTQSSGGVKLIKTTGVEGHGVPREYLFLASHALLKQKLVVFLKEIEKKAALGEKILDNLDKFKTITTKNLRSVKDLLDHEEELTEAEILEVIKPVIDNAEIANAYNELMT